MTLLRSLLVGSAAFVWFFGFVLGYALYDLMRWHPQQTLTVAGAFFGTLMVGIWLSLE